MARTRSSRPTRSGIPSWRSQQEAEQERRKAEEIEREIEEGLQAPADTKDEVPPTPAKKPKGKGKGKGIAKERDISVISTKGQLLSHLQNDLAWAPTRFPCPIFLQETELYDGVLQLLESMGLQSLLTMEAQPLYVDASCHFLSSLEVFPLSDGPPEFGYGRIQFKIRGKLYKLSYREINDDMGFKDDRFSDLPRNYNIPDKVWPLIAEFSHDPQRNKNSSIRNPVVRYVHRILGNTLFARRESGNVLDDELTMIAMALIPLFGKDALYIDEEDV